MEPQPPTDDHPPLRYRGVTYRATKEFVAGTHRAMPPEETLERIRPHLPEAGITRVADITGLDTAGVPVVVAIRPASQTLAVEGGKGATLTAAATSAAMEALERFVAEEDRVEDVEATVGEVADRLGGPIEQFSRLRFGTVSSRRRYTFSTMWDLGADREALAPAALVRLNMVEGYGVHTPWATSSNGLASGNHLPEALCAALYEVIERDATSCWKVAQDRGFPRLIVDRSTITSDIVNGLLDQLDSVGIRTTVAWCPSDIGVPTCHANIVDDQRHMGVYGGYGCHLDPEIAMIRAITEAVQGRTIFAAGARDDLMQGAYETIRRTDVAANNRFGLDGVSVSVADIPNRATGSFHGDIAVMLALLRAAGFERVLARELDAARFEIAVARVIVPGLEPYRFPWIAIGERARTFDPTPWTSGRRALSEVVAGR